MEAPIVLAVTGASGAIYAVRLLDVLANLGRPVHLLISPSGATVLEQELGLRVNLNAFDPASLLVLRSPPAERPHPVLRAFPSPSPAPTPAPTLSLTYHHHGDFLAPVASGSFLTLGMVVCPCSGSTLSGIAHAASGNLIQRAADVHLKERRQLILVPRETPLSTLQLENLHRVAQAGAVVLPAMPGWYHGVQSLADLVDFVVARILDQLELPHQLTRRWGT